MDVIEIVKTKLELLIDNTYVGNERTVISDLKTVITESLLELNGVDNLQIIGKSNIRSFQDIEIVDNDKLYKIDINMHDIKKVISLPSLMSIKRAKDFLTDSNNYITYIFVDYYITTVGDDDDSREIIKIKKISVQNIESLDWSYLSIQNLGKGQLQMKNISTELTFNNDITRKEWLAILKKKGSIYYENLLLKITEYKSKWEEDK